MKLILQVIVINVEGRLFMPRWLVLIVKRSFAYDVMHSGTLFFFWFSFYIILKRVSLFFRYPECEFDADDDEYSCPACEGFCNCTVCCCKRGEAYVGARRCDKYTPPPQHPARVKLGAKTNLPPPSSSRAKIKTTTIPKRATNAWGSLYNIYFIRW